MDAFLTLFGLSGAIVAVVVDRQFERRHERRRSERDEIAAEVGSCAGSYYVVRRLLQRVAELPVDSEASQAALDEVRVAEVEFNSSVARIRLAGSNALAAAANNLDEVLDRLPRRARTDQLSESTWKQLRTEAETACTALIERGRRELGLEAIDPTPRAEPSDDPS